MGSSALPSASPNAELPPQAPRVPQTEQGLANPPKEQSDFHKSRLSLCGKQARFVLRDPTSVRLLTPLLFLPPLRAIDRGYLIRFASSITSRSVRAFVFFVFSVI